MSPFFADLLQLPVPWAENHTRLTALFEALVIDWLKIGTLSEVAERLGLSWSAVSGVQERAVARGLARRQRDFPDSMGIDETAFQRRHQYVTVISSEDRVLHVADVPGAEHKIAFDKFHVAKHLGDAVDKVRWTEHKALLAAEVDEGTITDLYIPKR